MHPKMVVRQGPLPLEQREGTLYLKKQGGSRPPSIVGDYTALGLPKHQPR
jgi:hypothetical protein